MKYTKEVLLTALLIVFVAGNGCLLVSCGGFRAVVEGRSNIYRSDTIHTIYRYDKDINSLNVGY